MLEGESADPKIAKGITLLQRQIDQDSKEVQEMKDHQEKMSGQIEELQKQVDAGLDGLYADIELRAKQRRIRRDERKARMQRKIARRQARAEAANTDESHTENQTEET